MEENVAVTADQYAELCDVVERAWQRMPVESFEDDKFRHTSDYARAASVRIVDALGLEVEDPRNQDRMRSVDDIRDAEQEYFEQLWHHRATSVPRDAAETAQSRELVAQIEAAYGDQLKSLSPEYVSGVLSALRWVLGSDWHNLDT